VFPLWSPVCLPHCFLCIRFLNGITTWARGILRQAPDEIKVAIQERAPAAYLKRLMADKGESTIFEKAVREAGAGVISLEEACKFRDQLGQLVAIGHDIVG
jgi:hypothetical protein